MLSHILNGLCGGDLLCPLDARVGTAAPGDTVN